MPLLLSRLRLTSHLLISHYPSFSTAVAAARSPLPISPLLPPSSDIAASLTDWFKLSTNPTTSTLDQIYSALSSSPDDSALDSSLSLLRLRLSESLVLQTLNHRPLFLPHNTPHLLLLRLRFFDWSGRQSPFRHTRSTYHAVFRLLSKARLVSVVLDWLRLFSNSSDLHKVGTFFPFPNSDPSASSQPRFHDTLIIGYAVAGKPDLALQLLARIRFYGVDIDAFTYHVLANSFVELSKFDYADSVLNQLSARGFNDPVTACIRIKNLCRQDRLNDAVMYLRELNKDPKSSYQAVAGRMVGTIAHALLRKKEFESASRIMDEFGSPDSYSVWVDNLVGAGKLDAALEFLESKKELDDYIPESSHYSKLIMGLLRDNRLEDVYNILVEMMEEGIAPDRAAMSAALCFFCKAGMVEVANLLYNFKKELGIKPHWVVYEQLITALCHAGNVDDVCQVMEDAMQEGYFPRKQTFSLLANLLCREGKLDAMRKLLDSALERETKPPTIVFARYISALFRAGEVEEASLVPHMIGNYAGLLGRYKSTYVNLIKAFIMLRRVDVLPQLILEMQDQGHIPSRDLYASVVCCLCEMGQFDETFKLLNNQLERTELDKTTCYNYFIDGAGRAKRPEIAKEVYNRMDKDGIQPTIDTSFLILLSYLRSKRNGEAISFFYSLREQREPSTKLYNLIITGLSEAGMPDQAIVFWREMRNKGLTPSLQCYEELVLTLSSSKDYGLVVKVLRDFCETGRPVSSFLCNVLLMHTLKSPDLLHAWASSREATSSVMNNKTQGSTAVMLEHLLALFSGGIRLKEHVDKIDEVVESFFPTDIYTYNMLLRALSRIGRMDHACDLFERISKKGLEPNRWSFDIMVHGYCKQGMRSEAERWMQAMYRSGFCPTWYTMRMYNNTN